MSGPDEGALERLLEKAIGEHEENRATLDTANKRKEDERQEFLSAFRKALENSIRPVFKEAQESPAVLRRGFTLESDIDDHKHEARLVFVMGTQRPSSLTYWPDYQRMQVKIFISLDLDHQHRHEIGSPEPKEITADQVRKTVARFVRSSLHRGVIP